MAWTVSHGAGHVPLAHPPIPFPLPRIWGTMTCSGSETGLCRLHPRVSSFWLSGCCICLCYLPRPRGKGTATSFGWEPAEAQLITSDQSHSSEEERCHLCRLAISDSFWLGASSVGSACRLQRGGGHRSLLDKLPFHGCFVGHPHRAYLL